MTGLRTRGLIAALLAAVTLALTAPRPAAAADSERIASKGDTTKMASALLASQDAEKTFSQKDGTLSFEFSMMGNTETVTLTKK